MYINYDHPIELNAYTTLRPINKRDWQNFNLKSFYADKKNVKENLSEHYTLTMLSKDGFQYSHYAVKELDIDIEKITFLEYVYCEAVFVFIMKGDNIIAAYWVDKKE